MEEKIVFYRDHPEMLEKDCEILETYDFDEDLPSAAYVRYDKKYESGLQENER
ncbi:hypothetical protein [Halomicrococcus sp. NG-SE-24]|uniref:hypothetical protein n=1 Tax=Halomicrococcus sp. NG-SE-24 TaxID=3436928 RepID=UPI003D9760F1